MIGHSILPGFHPPAEYTNELFGVEYLYAQTGDGFNPDINTDAETGIEGGSELDEGVVEQSLDTDTCALPSGESSDEVGAITIYSQSYYIQYNYNT